MWKKVLKNLWIFLFFGILLYFIFEIVIDIPQPIYMKDEIVSYDKTVKPGGIVHAERLVYDEPKNCEVYVERYLTSEPDFNKQFLIEVYIHDSNYLQNPTRLHLLYHIPNTVLPGDYLIISKVQYYCNWFDYIRGGRPLQRIPLQIKVIEE